MIYVAVRLALLSLAFLPMPAAAAKLEPVRSERGNEDKIQIVDLHNYIEFAPG